MSRSTLQDHVVARGAPCTTSRNPTVRDEYLLLVRMDGSVQCVDVRTRCADVWRLSTKGGSLCVYHQQHTAARPLSDGTAPLSPSTSPLSASPVSPADAAASRTLSAVPLPPAVAAPIMMAGYCGASATVRTYVLSGSELVLADDHRLLNQDLLVSSLATFNTVASTYLEVLLRSGEVIVDGVDDAKKRTPVRKTVTSFDDLGGGPVLAIVRQDRVHTGRLRHRRGAADATVWKFCSAGVNIVDLDSPSLRDGLQGMLGAASVQPERLLICDRVSDDSEPSSHVASPTGVSTPLKMLPPISPTSSTNGAKPARIEVFVDGRWRCSVDDDNETFENDDGDEDGGRVEIIRAYHYCSRFASEEKLHEIPVHVFPSSPTSRNSSSAGGAELYIKPSSHFMFIDGDAPSSLDVRRFLERKGSEASDPLHRNAWRVKLPNPNVGSSALVHPEALRKGLQAAHHGTSLLHKAVESTAEATAAQRVELVETSSSASLLRDSFATSHETGPSAKVEQQPVLQTQAPFRPASMFVLDESSCSSVSEHQPLRRHVDPAATAPTLSNDLNGSDSDAQTEVMDGVDSTASSAAATPVTGRRAPGSFFDANFAPIRVLGHGTSGVVILCRQRSTGILYAIKVIVVESKFAEDEVLCEVKLHAGLQSDYIVRYHSCWSETVTRRRAEQLAQLIRDCGVMFDGMVGGEAASECEGESTEGGDSSSENSESTVSTAVSTITRSIGRKAMFLQMEYCNTNLSVRLGLRRAIDRVENLSVAIQIITGVMYLHERNIVHRDIKPSNIMLLIDGTADEELSSDVLAADLHAFARHLRKRELSQRKPTRSAGAVKKGLSWRDHLHRSGRSGNSLSEATSHESDETTASDSSDDDEASDQDDANGVFDDDDVYTPPYTIKLGDLGLAKVEGAMSLVDPSGYFASNDSHTLGVGSPIYSSPEQLSGAKCHVRGDVFSVGVLLVELYLKPATVSERLDVLLKARERRLPESLVAAYPELKVARGMLYSQPERRLSLDSARRKLRKHLASLVKLRK